MEHPEPIAIEHDFTAFSVRDGRLEPVTCVACGCRLERAEALPRYVVSFTRAPADVTAVLELDALASPGADDPLHGERPGGRPAAHRLIA